MLCLFLLHVCRAKSQKQTIRFEQYFQLISLHVSWKSKLDGIELVTVLRKCSKSTQFNTYCWQYVNVYLPLSSHHFSNSKFQVHPHCMIYCLLFCDHFSQRLIKDVMRFPYMNMKKIWLRFRIYSSEKATYIIKVVSMSVCLAYMTAGVRRWGLNFPFPSYFRKTGRHFHFKLSFDGDWKLPSWLPHSNLQAFYMCEVVLHVSEI